MRVRLGPDQWRRKLHKVYPPRPLFQLNALLQRLTGTGSSGKSPRITKSQRPEIAGKAAAVTPHVAQIALIRSPSAHAGSH